MVKYFLDSWVNLGDAEGQLTMFVGNLSCKFMSYLHFDSHIPLKQTVTPSQILDNLRHIFVISRGRKLKKTTKLFMKELTFRMKCIYKT